MPPKKRSTAAKAAPVAAVSPAEPAADRLAPAAAAVMVLVVLASAWAVDTGAEAAFDAPKRLLCLLGIAIATFVQFGVSPSLGYAEAWRRQTTAQRTALVLFVVAIAGTMLAALASPRSDVSAPAARVVLTFALLLPLGASSALDGGRSRWLAAALLASAALNASIALLESFGAIRPFAVASLPGRSPAIGFVGNEGLLAIGLALASAVAFGMLLRARGPRLWIAGGALALFASTLLVSGNLTAVTSAGAAIAVGALVRSTANRGRLVLVGVAGLVSLIAVATLSSGRAGAIVSGLRAGDLNPLLTFRLGAWGAAVEMIRERPLLGFGPGTFGAEFVPHRLAAEMHLQRRFTAPGVMQASFGEAHDEYLQALAELGIPVAGAIFAATAVVLVGLWRVALRGEATVRDEAATLLAILVAGVVSAITWFPFQSPVLAVPLLIAAGRGWRLLDAERPGA